MTLREKVEAVLLHEADQLPRATFDGEVEKFARAAIRAVLEWEEEIAYNLDKAQGFGNARLAFISALREEFGK